MKRQMRKVPIDQLTTPKRGMFQVYVDDWWAVSEDEELYFYACSASPFASPQCNGNEELAKRMHAERRVCDEKFKDCELTGLKETRRIPVVYVPINIGDYV